MLKQLSNLSNQTRHMNTFLCAICAVVFVSGCTSTVAQAPVEIEKAYAVGQRIDSDCKVQVSEREQAVRDSQSPAQFLALASQANRCLDNIRFYPTHPDNQEGMRLNALAIVNYVKAGDIKAAEKSLARFKMRFTQQDLVFDDYTSFIDTATALLDPNLSSRQLAMLNINPTLRSELNRKRQWSLQ